MKYLRSFLFAGLLLASASTNAQTIIDPSVGLSASLQGEQIDLSIPIWVSDQFVLAPIVGLAMNEDFGTDLHLGIEPRYYFRKATFAPYIGFKLGALMFSPESGESTTDIIAGIGVGGEYFLDPHFSLGVEGQLNAVFADENSARFGNPGKMNLNTGSAIFATIYF